MHSATMSRAALPRRLLALAAALTLAFALLPTLAAQAQDVTPARVDGETRFHTAANIATLTFEEAEVAHIAFAGAFPDALAASFAAGSVEGPILLSEHDGVPQPTWDALAELDVERVVLVGGPLALSDDVAAELAAAGYEVDRVQGVDRYQTASAVAMRYGTDFGVGELEGDRTAILASGEVFPDALSAGPIAYSARFPLFLTPPNRTEVSVNTSLQQLDIERIVIIGGTAAVSSAVVLHYQDAGYEVERWGGNTRTDTARIVSDNALARLGFTVGLTLLARGDNFPDALTASVHGGANRAPLLLAATPNTLSSPTVGWLRAACPDVEAVRAIGGTAAITPETLDAAVTEADSCDEGPGQAYGVAPMQPVELDPGETHEVSVRFDDGDPSPIHFALFPCEAADPVAAPPHVFADGDDDDFADSIGTSSTGNALITSVNEDETSTAHLTGLEPGADNLIEFTLDSDAEDCVVPVAFHDLDGNDELDLDAENRPLEPFGYGQYSWAD